MQTTKTRIRGLACTAGLVLAALAASAPEAAAGAGANAAEPTAERALLIRSKVLNCTYGRAQDCMTSAELRALMIRSVALNRKYAPGTTN
jgi:hypothetical protein